MGKRTVTLIVVETISAEYVLDVEIDEDEFKDWIGKRGVYRAAVADFLEASRDYPENISDLLVQGKGKRTRTVPDVEITISRVVQS